MKKLSPRAKNIAICVTALSHAGGQVLSGMMRYVSEFPGWNIRLMTFPQVATPDLLRKFESEQVDGLIISYCPSSDFHKAIRELTIPVVAIDRDDLVGRRLSHIRTGQRQIGVTAARHFLSLGRFASFGFVPFHDSAIWSIERQAGYCAELSCQHRDVAICPNPATTINRHDLATWLKDLKKPAAVMAANDALAAEVLSVAHAAGLHVPKDLAVIGVDNDPTYCTISSPRLTSVDPNFHQLGYLAAKEIDDLTDRQSRRMVGRTIICPPSGVSVRESTRPLPPATALIEKAIEIINREACHGLTVGQLTRRLGVSPALLTLRFRERGKGTVQEMIIATRIRRARQLLSTTNNSLSSIAAACGMKTANRLSHLFKIKTGRSIASIRGRPEECGD